MDKKFKDLAEMLKGQNEVLQGLLKDAAVPPDVTPLHGQGGLWSMGGLSREIINAKIEPHGLSKFLPLLPSVDTNPIFGAILGVESDGSRITEPCEDAPTGYAKGGTLTAKFGLTRFDTRTIDLMEVGLRKHRGDFTDLVLRGGLLGDAALSPQSIRAMSDREFFTNLVASEMLIAGINAQRELSQDLWQGTVAVGAFPGLDIQINTGHVDAYTNAVMPSLDSKLYDFNYNDVSGESPNIVEIMHAMEHWLYYNSVHMGFDPVQWIIVVRPELWEELINVWVCKYMTNHCADTGTAGSERIITVNNDGAAAELRNTMKNAMYLDINGRRYPVVMDTGIYQYDWDNDENLGEGEYASSIYFVPLTVQGGGFRTTYREYVDYSAAEQMLDMIKQGKNFWSDGGVYSWSIEDEKGWCAKLALRSQQRVILRTPHLAGKIQKVKYAPIMPIRSPYQDETYFLDGGVSMRSDETFYSVWL